MQKKTYWEHEKSAKLDDRMLKRHPVLSRKHVFHGNQASSPRTRLGDTFVFGIQQHQPLSGILGQYYAMLCYALTS